MRSFLRGCERRFHICQAVHPFAFRFLVPSLCKFKRPDASGLSFLRHMQTGGIQKTILLILIIVNCLKMEAQKTASSPVGEYLLRNVMETACGFKLNEDSSFQFFFSYGALDRYGEGKWSVQNDKVVFNSKPRPATDFALIDSSAGMKKKILIQLTEVNEMMRRHVYCKIKGGGKEQEAMTNDKGVAEFASQTVETIELIFEFCPEKTSVFHVSNKGLRSFRFRPEPWLMEVFFQNFPLRLTEDGFVGGHPLSNQTSFRYEKTNR